MVFCKAYWSNKSPWEFAVFAKKIRWILIGHILAPACGFLLLRLSTTSGSVALLKKQGQSTVFFRKLNPLLKLKWYWKRFSLFSKICLSLVLTNKLLICYHFYLTGMPFYDFTDIWSWIQFAFNKPKLETTPPTILRIDIANLEMGIINFPFMLSKTDLADQ